ncbi:MAG: M13 family peptidase, partial [Acidobacteriota bacterium]|nr:M13 family peptidase [Acidobacteriota bacterium]
MSRRSFFPMVQSSILLTALAASLAAQTPAAPAPSAQHELKVFDRSLIDTSVNPCENFYRFSCNGWLKRNPLPPDQAEYGRFTELYEINRLHLRQILELAAAPVPTRTPNEQKIGDEYASCMDAAEIDKQGLAPIQPELERIAALQSLDQLPTLLGHLHTVGVDAFFGLDAEQDFANSSAMISFYSAGGLGLPERDYY